MTDIGEQIGALPMHWDKKGNLQVLMVTSRDTGRWVMPKGWLMDGKKPWAAAEIEALGLGLNGAEFARQWRAASRPVKILIRLQANHGPFGINLRALLRDQIGINRLHNFSSRQL